MKKVNIFMPIYEFKCDECNFIFEELLKTPAASSALRCRQCGSFKVHRIISMFGFAAKGSDGQTIRSSSAGKNCSSCHSHQCGHCH